MADGILAVGDGGSAIVLSYAYNDLYRCLVTAPWLQVSAFGPSLPGGLWRRMRHCSVIGTRRRDTKRQRGMLSIHDILHVQPRGDNMVRSTTIFRVSDALPLAASVDDESVSISLSSLPESSSRCADGEGPHGIQAAVQARLPETQRQQRTSLLDRERAIHPSVSQICANRVSS